MSASPCSHVARGGRSLLRCPLQVSRHLCERWNISQILTPADPADCASLDERSAEVLRSSICSVVSEKPGEWDTHLDPVLFDFRTSVNAATKYTPFFLMFNRYVCLSSEVTAQRSGVMQEVLVLAR